MALLKAPMVARRASPRPLIIMIIARHSG